MIILGIDPGSIKTGYAFLQSSENSIRVLEYGVISRKASDPLIERISHIHGELRKLCLQYQPNWLSMEASFLGRNAKTAMVLAHARGAIMSLAGEFSLRFSEFAPREVKQIVSGKGSADKNTVAWMMQQHLQLRDLPQPEDAADALAIAWCAYINSSDS